jgi:hypothetical protein
MGFLKMEGGILKVFGFAKVILTKRKHPIAQK